MTTRVGIVAKTSGNVGRTGEIARKIVVIVVRIDGSAATIAMTRAVAIGMRHGITDATIAVTVLDG
jgi:hypothetical protein